MRLAAASPRGPQNAFALLTSRFGPPFCPAGALRLRPSPRVAPGTQSLAGRRASVLPTSPKPRALAQALRPHRAAARCMLRSSAAIRSLTPMSASAVLGLGTSENVSIPVPPLGTTTTVRPPDDLPLSAKKPIDPAKLHGGSGDHGRRSESARAANDDGVRRTRSHCDAAQTQHRDRAVLLRAGLSEHGLARAADEGNGLPQRVSAIGQCKFLEYAAEAMYDSAFGLHLAGQIDPRDVGMYFYAGSALAISAKRSRSFCAIAGS